MREETKTGLYIRNSNPLSLAACKEILNVQGGMITALEVGMR
jgi:hypothetical protein